MNSSTLPAPSGDASSNLNRGYVLGPGDRISVEVFGVDELTRTVQVDSLGRIALPLVGEFAASGTVPSELSDTIEQRLRAAHVRDPDVTVNLVEGKSQVVTVDGEVEEPGLYPVVGRMTLMHAVATAKGATEYAQKSHVVVFREVDNQQMAALYDLQAIRRGMYEDPEIYANDVIVVGEASARRLFQTFVQAGALLAGPLIAVIQR